MKSLKLAQGLKCINTPLKFRRLYSETNEGKLKEEDGR